MPFVESARSAFAYLVSDFDFLGPHVETGRAYIALDYSGRGVGVRVEFDAREETVDVLLVPLTNGEWPKRDEHGWTYLDRIARVRGRPVVRTTADMPRSEAEIDERIAQQAASLRAVAADLLTGDPRELDRFCAGEQPA